MLARIGHPNGNGTKDARRLHALVLDMSLLILGQILPHLGQLNPGAFLEKKDVACREDTGTDDLAPADQLGEDIGVGGLMLRQLLIDQAFVGEAGG